jgi:hypothetical protein
MKLGAFSSILLAVTLVVGQAAVCATAASASASPNAKSSSKSSGHSSAPATSPTAGSNKAVAPCDWTPLLMVPISTPRLFRGSDGLYNLVYELQLINYNAKPSKITSFEVHNARGGLIKSYSPAALHANLLNVSASKVAKPAKDGETLPAGGVATVWINLEFKDKESAPKELQHKITIETEFAGKVRKFENALSKLTVDEKPPVVVGPPLKGGRWFASGGYAGKAGHRKALFPQGNTLVNAQRYAIDWLLMTDDNHAFKGEGKNCAHFAGYGKPLIAVADGTVVGVIDKFEDQTPGTATGEQLPFFPGGNTAVIDIGDGNYAFYAHMKPGSVKVKEGQKVKRGDHIGDLGSSGNSGAPHLHFHVMSGPSILGSPSVPYVFDSFVVSGITSDEDKAEKAMEDGGVAPITKSKFDGKHTEELPREGMLIVFPD